MISSEEKLIQKTWSIRTIGPFAHAFLVDGYDALSFGDSCHHSFHSSYLRSSTMLKRVEDSLSSYLRQSQSSIGRRRRRMNNSMREEERREYDYDYDDDDGTRVCFSWIETPDAVDGGEWSDDGTTVSTDDEDSCHDVLGLGHCRKEGEAPPRRGIRRRCRHLHADVWLRDEHAAQVVLCFARGEEFLSVNRKGDGPSRGGAAYAAAVSSFSFVLLRGAPRAFGPVLSWLERNRGCVVGKRSFRPSSSDVSRLAVGCALAPPPSRMQKDDQISSEVSNSSGEAEGRSPGGNDLRTLSPSAQAGGGSCCSTETLKTVRKRKRSALMGSEHITPHGSESTPALPSSPCVPPLGRGKNGHGSPGSVASVAAVGVIAPMSLRTNRKTTKPPPAVGNEDDLCAGRARPLEVTFEAPPPIALAGLERVTLTVPPSDLSRLCHAIENAALMREHDDDEDSDGNEDGEGARAKSLRERLREFPILRALRCYFRDAFGIDLSYFKVIRMGCDAAVFGCDGRLKLLDADLLPLILRGVEDMVCNQLNLEDGT